MAISAPLYSVQGEKLREVKLPEEIFAVKINEPLLAQGVRSYLSRQRQNTKKVKTRGEVSLTTAKVWRQKGTGRARHGARSAPIFVGGGVAHGPKGNENYKLNMSKNMRHAALRSALSVHAHNKTICLIDNLDTLKGKTKDIVSLVDKLYPKDKLPPKILFILDSPHTLIIKSVKNYQNITSTQALRLNLFEVLNHASLIFTPKSLELLVENLSLKKTKVS